MPHYTFWHLHRNKNHSPGEPIGILVPGKTCDRCRGGNMETFGGAAKATGASIEELKKEFLKKKLSKASFQALEFINTACENNMTVTFEQAAKINPKYPSDPANYARQRGWEVKTDRKNKIFKVGNYVPRG